MSPSWDSMNLGYLMMAKEVVIDEIRNDTSWASRRICSDEKDRVVLAGVIDEDAVAPVAQVEHAIAYVEQRQLLLHRLTCISYFLSPLLGLLLSFEEHGEDHAPFMYVLGFDE